MKRLLLAVAAVLALVVAAPAYAADGVTLSGTATVEGDHIKFVSDFSDAVSTNDAGSAMFAIPAGTTLNALTTLSAVYNVTDDDCGGGSPRFQIAIGGHNLFVYLGPSPNFIGCTHNTWLSSGNLVGTSDACRVDTSQFAGGTQCSTWAAALTLLGSQTVQSILFAVDGGWKLADKEQTVLLRSATINNTTFTFGPQAGGGGGGNLSPGQFCKSMRSRMGAAAFNEWWGRNANSANGMGKCVSTIAHARNAGATEQQILAALATCMAQNKKGAALGACVAANDGVAATLTEAQEAKIAAKSKAKKKARHR